MCGTTSTPSNSLNTPGIHVVVCLPTSAYRCHSLKPLRSPIWYLICSISLIPLASFQYFFLIYRGPAVLTINSSALSPSCWMECWTLHANPPIIWCIPSDHRKGNSLPRICRSIRHVPLTCSTQNQYIPNVSRSKLGSPQLTDFGSSVQFGLQR